MSCSPVKCHCSWEGSCGNQVELPDPCRGQITCFPHCTKLVPRKLLRLCSLIRKVGGDGPEKQTLMSVGERVLSLHVGEGPICPGFQKEGTQRAGWMAKS